MSAPEKKIFKILMISIAVIAVGVLVKEIFLTVRPIEVEPLSAYVTPIEVNFDLLEDPNFEEMILFENIKMPEKFGRDNPFLPY